MKIKIRDEIRDGGHFVVAEGPSPRDIAQELYRRLVSDIHGKIDMEFARQLVKLGWTPPAWHPVRNENPPASDDRG